MVAHTYTVEPAAGGSLFPDVASLSFWYWCWSVRSHSAPGKVMAAHHSAEVFGSPSDGEWARYGAAVSNKVLGVACHGHRFDGEVEVHEFDCENVGDYHRDGESAAHDHCFDGEAESRWLALGVFGVDKRRNLEKTVDDWSHDSLQCHESLESLHRPSQRGSRGVRDRHDGIDHDCGSLGSHV